ncbi:hypothetical protein ACEWY4_021585 [Coilia grayii]|uniref:ribonuclease H n=1 Tax=Coilia grayii TaxID=363190 RepID=A0ABD1J9E2_9TELE
MGALVRVGQQLEKDKEKFEQRQKPAMKATTKSDSGRQEAPPPKQTTVFCWRCKEVGHPPGSCPKFPNQKGSKPGKHAQDHQSPVPSSGPQFSLVTHADVDNSDLCCSVPPPAVSVTWQDQSWDEVLGHAITLPDAYPLPTIHEILESLAGATIFSTIDLNSGYWQVEMADESQLKTAFVCSKGQFHFKVVPFGLRNAPASFQRLMETVLVNLKGQICFMYLDDNIIYSRDVQQHLQDIQQVFCALRKAGLTLNMKKSQFCRKSLKFLGHLVSAEGIQADPEKTTAVQQYPVPTTLKSLQRFLGMAGWYHRFVPNFSQIAVLLNALKRKGAKFRWTQECQQAFEQLKQHLVSPPVLGHPNFSYPFIVYTDASELPGDQLKCSESFFNGSN